MDQIIDRLRTLQDHYSTSGNLGPENRRIFAEAANEIERLRRQLSHMEVLVAGYKSLARS